MLRENVPLSSLTTFRIGGPARFVYEGNSLASLKVALAQSSESGLPLYPIGQGSNLLAGDAPIDAVILRMTSMEIAFAELSGGIEVCADAGVSWDELVRASAARGLWGIENLAGIPGTAGAAPVQNIGAYGSELADTLAWVECYDTATGAVARLNREECAFGYRESRFKHEPNLIILRVALALSRSGIPKMDYADLARLIADGEAMDSPSAIGDSVRRVRSRKFPDLAQYGTAGSFFKNPTITTEAYIRLQAQYPGLPGFVTEAGVKIPLAWILDHVLGLRGFRMGKAYLFENQPLVLVADTGAAARDVDALAEAVKGKVFDATGISIEREVRSLA